MNTKILVNIVVVLLVIAALFVVYYQFIRDSEETPELIRSGDARGSQFASAEQSEFLVSLNIVRGIDFDPGILSSERFTSGFTDFTTELPNLSTGRSNPFADFGTGNFNFSPGQTPQAETFTDTDTESDTDDDNTEPAGE